MKKTVQFLLSPWIITIVPATILLLLIPLNIAHYNLELINIRNNISESWLFFEDFDNDGVSEEIRFSDNVNGSGFAIRRNGELVDQWNIKGKFSFDKKRLLYLSGDRDNDGFKEIYVFSIFGDSIFFSSLDNILDQELKIKNRFITCVGKSDGEADPYLIGAEMDDLDSDGQKELIFGISTGFSLFPRNIFAYNFISDTLLISPESQYSIYEIFQSDINGDGIREIIPFGYSSANSNYENTLYHDHSCWIMVLDSMLRFLYEPVELPGKFSNVVPLRTDSTTEELFFLNRTIGEGRNSALYSYNPAAGIQKQKELERHFYDIIPMNEGEDIRYLAAIADKGLALLDEEFKIIRLVTFPPEFSYYRIDLDSDGEKEVVVISPHKGEITTLRRDLTKPAKAPLDWAGGVDLIVSLREAGPHQSQLYIQEGRKSHLYEYRVNAAYPYNYAVYLAVYLSFVLFTLLVRQIQKNQILNRRELEQKITRLQLSMVKNQLDPHFSMNVLSSIIESVKSGETDKAADHLMRFADMYRSILLSADTPRRTLEEEIEFTINYLEMEKLRLGTRLKYRVAIHEGVDRKSWVPRMMIQVHTENAVKHGLGGLNRDGFVTLDCHKRGNELVIQIEDNGIGRKKAEDSLTHSTGKGSSLLDESYILFNKYYGITIFSEITDLYNEAGDPSGTRIELAVTGS